MVFSSYVFLFWFLPGALAVYYALSRAPQRARNGVLALLGYAFYGWAGPKYLLLMGFTTLLDWFLSLVIARDSWAAWKFRGPVEPLTRLAERSKRQKRAILFSVLSNLAMLGFFKYFNWGVDTYNSALGWLGLDARQWNDALRIALPLGISFYTFQSLSYIIDVYRGDARAMRSFVDFACFVSMFPHLVAGPILKFSFLADQLESRSLTMGKFARGVAFFCFGLGKKVLLANPMATIADAAFSARAPHTLDAWLGAVAYAFQIFFDFSGYSDMAIGLGLMLGFVFARNFDHPYRASSLTDFWRRWHISLSTWLREYLYIPLGGNRFGVSRTYVNLFMTMLLGGLWHGASWTFVLWGAMHGAGLAFERAMPKNGLFWKIPAPIRMLTTFVFVLIAWVFFRAPDFPSATHFLEAMAGRVRPDASSQLLPAITRSPYELATFALCCVSVWILPDTWEWTQNLPVWKAATCLVVFWLSVIMLATQTYNPFIYFIF